jgi:diguanylate cyclase (GGDEF)-like protein/PAS domain S-box-containing protein
MGGPLFSTGTVRSLLRFVAGMCALAILEIGGWAGRTPWLVTFSLSLILAVLLYAPVNRATVRRLEGPWHLAVGLHMLCLATVVYAVGWGSALALVALSVMTADMRTVGPQAWRPAAVWGVVWFVGGEALVASGLVFSYLDARERFLVDGIVGITLVNVAGAIGRSAERRGREAVARAAAEQGLVERQQRLDTLLGSSFELIVLVHDDGTIGYVSPSLEERLGVKGQHAGSVRVDELIVGGVVHPDDIDTAAAGVVAAIDHHQSRFELRLRDLPAEGGRWRWWEAVVTDLRADPAVRGLVANVRDVSARKQEQGRLAAAALTDALTGLPNRAAFLQRLDAALDTRAAYPASPGRNGSAVAVLFIDLDGFKAVNDRLGHDWGDKLLIQVADELVGAVRTGEVVARWAGDEFVVLAEGVGSRAEASAVASRLSEALGQCGWRVDGGEDVVVSGSVGVAMARPGTITARELIRQADTAMYSIKSDRRPENWGRPDVAVSQ